MGFLGESGGFLLRVSACLRQIVNESLTPARIGGSRRVPLPVPPPLRHLQRLGRPSAASSRGSRPPFAHLRPQPHPSRSATRSGSEGPRGAASAPSGGSRKSIRSPAESVFLDCIFRGKCAHIIRSMRRHADAQEPNKPRRAGPPPAGSTNAATCLCPGPPRVRRGSAGDGHGSRRCSEELPVPRVIVRRFQVAVGTCREVLVPGAGAGTGCRVPMRPGPPGAARPAALAVILNKTLLRQQYGVTVSRSGLVRAASVCATRPAPAG